jgi:hypothetical protein
MKSILALALLAGLAVGIALCNSTGYYGWTPHKELIYRFESQVLTGIPALRSQYAGLKLSSDVVVQTFEDYSLRIAFRNPRFIVVNEELEVTKGRPQIPKATEDVPNVVRQALTQPFVAHLKRGVVEALFVEKSEPAVVTNIKKALLTQLQLDLTASRKREVTVVQKGNNVEKSELPKPIEDVTYFTTEESSVVGDCQTSYTMHPLPKYLAEELEERIRDTEKVLAEDGVIAGEPSQGEQACRGKEYFEITKTKNFDNCKERPTYQSIRGMKTNCDFSKAECKELMTQISASRYIVCGTPKEFIIREAQTDNDIVANPLGWAVTPGERMTLSARVTLMLLKVKGGDFTPLPKPRDPVEMRSLIYQFPRGNMYSTHETRDIAPRQESDKRGYQPILPMPNVTSGCALLPAFIPIQELRQKVVEGMEKVVREIFKSPESCSSKNDIAGTIHAIAQSLRPRNLHELEEIERSLSSASFGNEDRKVAREIWNDILAMTGSNACITMIKKKLENRQLVGMQASRVLQSAIRNARTPTKEILKELVQLVKSLKSERALYNTGLIQLSNLIQHACIDPTARTTQFPVRTYGLFCTRESEVVKEFVDYLTNRLKESGKSSERLVYIAALGKIGDRQVLLPLIKVVESKQASPMTRSVAVYSLKRLAKLEPSVVRPLLLKVIDNPAENTEVRIAAVSILPWTQPSVQQLQKIAVRSWFEPSKQVASFIHSTLHSLIKTKVPELMAVGIKAKGLETLIKPFQYGIQFSHNTHTQKFIEYLRVVSSVETAYVNTAESLVPARVSLSNQIYGGVWQVDGLTYSVYTNGMDHLVDKVLGYLGYESAEESEEVKRELNGIKEKLNIKGRKVGGQQSSTPESFVRYSLLGFHRVFAADKDIYADVLEKVSEELRGNPEVFSTGKHFNLTYTNYAIKVRVVLPSMAGFPIIIRRNMPVVFGIKGNFAVEQENNGSTMKGTIIPVLNGKVQSSMGVISPFNKKFIGSGVEASIHYSLPLTVRAELSRKGEFSLAIKNPENVQQKEFHAIHAFVKPFTVVKSLERMVPLNKASSFKEIKSGEPMKSFNLPLGRNVGIDAKLKVQADYKRLDFTFAWSKLSQHTPLSFLSLMYAPISARSASVEILYNPASSETKEIEARLSVVRGHKIPEIDIDEVSRPDPEDILETREAEIRAVCARRNEARLCEERMLERLASHRESHSNVRRMLNRLNAGRVNGINVDASFNSRSSRHAIKTYILVGSETKGDKVKTVVEVKFQTPEKPAFEIDVDAVTEVPDMPYRWDVQELIKQNLKMESKVKIRYGRADGGQKKEVDLEAILTQSEHQREAVRRSPELKKCEQEISKGRELSSICEETRHQAAAVDKVQLKVRVPEAWKKSQIVTKVEAAAMAYLWPVMYEETEYNRREEQEGGSGSSSHLSYEIDVLVNRTGDVAQAWVRGPASKIHFKNVTIPHQVRGLMPISLRNGIPMRLLQDVTRAQSPASCTVEDKEINTFDNKTYKFEMNQCQTLLFKDCSAGAERKRHVAVLAKKTSDGNRKDVKIISGANIVELKWKGSEVEVLVNGKVEPVQAGGAFRKHSKGGSSSSSKKHGGIGKREELVIRRTGGDGVVSVASPQEGMEVFFDGKKIEVIAPQLFHNRACGLCGDLNGEDTADVKSAQECIMRKPRFAAFSYMIKESHDCIPSEDRQAYEEDKRECLRTEYIATPLKRLAEKLLSKGVHPISTRHVVEVLENDVCVSKTMIKVCGKGQRPVKVRQQELSFACLTRGYSRTHQIKVRAEAGEEIFQVRDMPTEFTKRHAEAEICEAEDNEVTEDVEYNVNAREENYRHENNYRRENVNARENNYRNVNRNPVNDDDDEEEEYPERGEEEEERCRKNNRDIGKWVDSMKPSERIREMCDTKRRSFSTDEGVRMELKDNINKSDCKAAINFAEQEERKEKRSTWSLWSDFTCGRMTIVIKNDY